MKSKGKSVLNKRNRKKGYILCMFFLAVLFFILMWVIQLSHIQILHETIVESEQGSSFIADSDSICKFSLSADTSESIGAINSNEKGIISILDANGKTIWSDEIELKDIGVNQFGNQIDLSSQNIQLEKGQKYIVQIVIADQICQGISVCLYGNAVSFVFFYIVVCILILFAIVAVFTLFDSEKKNSFQKSFFAILFLVGVLNNFIMPQLCTPDETVHFSQSYAYASQLLGENGSGDSHVIVRESGIQRLDGTISAQSIYHFWTNWEYGNQQNDQESDKYVEANAVPFYAYLPATIALTVTRFFHAPYQIVLLSGRIVNLIFFGLICLLAMRCYRPLRYVIATIALLPSTVWLVASYSYDGWNLAFCMLFVAVCLNIREQEKGICLRDILILLFILLAFVPVKYIYVMMALAVFIIPFSQWKNRRLLWGCGAASGVLIVAMAVSRGPEIVSYLTSANMDVRGRLADGSSRHYTLGWVFQHPVYVILVFCKTFIQYSDKFLTKSMVGEFYNTYVPTFLTASFIIVFGLLMITNIETGEVCRKCRYVAALIVLLGCAAVYGAFLFVYSNIADPMIGMVEGMQGRYFLPYFIFIPLIICSSKVYEWIQKQKDAIGMQKIGVQELLLKLLILLNVWFLFCKFIGMIQ